MESSGPRGSCCGACGGDETIVSPSNTTTNTNTTVSTPQPTPRPTPTPNPSLVGLWKIANTGNLGALKGYAIEISTHNVATGEIRGRSVFPYPGFTGLLTGTVKSNGRVEWQTRYGGSDSENGSFDLETGRRWMEGQVKFEINALSFWLTYTGVALQRSTN